MIKGISAEEMLELQNPLQYLGGERGSVTKDPETADLQVCLAFPDTYEVGMSHIGLQILYDVVNRIPGVWGQRAYAPQKDFEQLLRRKNVKLCSIEEQRPLHQFDVVGFSLQYELCMNGVLTLLDLGGLPLLAGERGETDPIVIGGGPVATHPEPYADFFDAFLIGDCEELLPEFLSTVREGRAAKLPRQELLLRCGKLSGVYLPLPAASEPGPDSAFAGFDKSVQPVQRRFMATLEGAPFPRQPIIPNVRAVHDRLSVEVMRGCVRGCRFCQAGYIYRPQRERKPEELLEIVAESLDNTGYEELSLLSLSTADYCSILPLLSELKERFAEEEQLAISFPSTRVDSLKPELLQEVQSVRRAGFTIAPEAGTQRLRDLINKQVSEADLLETCSNVSALGWQRIKMYFMIGLPTETDEDVLAIADLAAKAKRTARGCALTVSVSTHVPKPHTPFQWAEQISAAETRRRQELLGRELKKLRVGFRYHDPFSSYLEGVFARGDRRLGRVILEAYHRGCRLDGWVEELKPDLWREAFAAAGVEPDPYLRERMTDEALPWDHIDCGIPKKYFKREWERALAVRVTPDCLTATCSICAVCDYDAARNVLFDRERTENRLKIVQPRWQKVIKQREQGLPIVLESSTPKPAMRRTPPERSGAYASKEYLRTEAPGSPALRPADQPAQQRIRLRYRKTGRARFIPHLDLSSTFFRAARRAGLPLAFSRGFNPKPKLSFGPPVQLGIGSDWEFVDIFLKITVDPEELRRRLGAELPQGLELLNVQQLTLKHASIQASLRWQRYSARRCDSRSESAAPVNIPENWPELQIERRRKGRSRVIRLGDSVSDLTWANDLLEFSIASNCSTPGLKPSEVVQALTQMDLGAFHVVKSAVDLHGL